MCYKEIKESDIDVVKLYLYTRDVERKIDYVLEALKDILNDRYSTKDSIKINVAHLFDKSKLWSDVNTIEDVIKDETLKAWGVK